MAKGSKTGGRVAGVPNKLTADIKALAQSHGPDAIATLVSIMTAGDYAPAARVAAAKELLDRGYGKSVQAVEMTGKDGQPIEFSSITRKIVRAP